MTYKKFIQNISVVIKTKDHEATLQIANTIKKQCSAWYFCVTHDEWKSARKGPVLHREIMIRQVAYPSDIVIFKEAVRRICEYFKLYHSGVEFLDRGSVPES
jgi:hypothetical protein